MGWCFRKVFKILPGVKVNLTRGVSTALGAAPISVNVGPEGVYRNVSIPGTGMWDRRRTGAPNAADSDETQITREACLSARVALVKYVQPLISSLPLTTSSLPQLRPQPQNPNGRGSRFEITADDLDAYGAAVLAISAAKELEERSVFIPIDKGKYHRAIHECEAGWEKFCPAD
jgi:hypothetical protein